MNNVLEILKKPYNFVSNKLCSNSRTQLVSLSISSARRANVFNSILSPFETYVVSFQSLLIWERPFLSAAAFLSINIIYWYIYWLIVTWNRRFCSILSIFALVFFICKTWVNQIWPVFRVPPGESEDTENWTALNPSVLSVPEISRYLNNFCEKMLIVWNHLWRLREENRGVFCTLMCGIFSIFALIGTIIPGVLFVYFLVLLVTLGPGVALHLIPPTVYDQLIGFIESDNQNIGSANQVSNSDKDSDIEEFIPEESAEVLRQLSLRDDVPEVPSPGMVLTESGDPDLTLGVDDSITDADELALYQGLGSFPSVEEEGESDLEDGISESDILPSLDEPKHEEMNFVSSHFKEDSSESESDAIFAEGLSFQQNKEKAASEASAFTKNDIAGKRKRTYSDSDDDDLADFEILDESDVLS